MRAGGDSARSASRVDHRLQAPTVEAGGLDGAGERPRHIVGRPLAGIDLLHRVAPPLQADLSQDRLRDHLAHPRDLVIEEDEGKEMGARLGGREQRGQIAVRVELARPLREVGPFLRGGVLNGHGRAPNWRRRVVPSCRTGTLCYPSR
jgi:hypothetical protein